MNEDKKAIDQEIRNERDAILRISNKEGLKSILMEVSHISRRSVFGRRKSPEG